MRLNCPNCGAEYEVPDGMIPSAGRHVQCTACHTRWFVRGVPGTGLTEDQILRRLETWSPAPGRPMPALVPMPAASAADAPGEAPPPPPPADTPPGDSPVADRAVADLPPTDPPVVVQLPPRKAPPAKPAERPAVAQPAPVSGPAPRPEPAVRSPARLDLGEPAPAPAEVPRPSQSRFARGLVLALLLAAVGLGAYLYRAPIAARVPAAGPALAAYGQTVDRWRAAIEERLAPLRDPAPADRD